MPRRLHALQPGYFSVLYRSVLYGDVPYTAQLFCQTVPGLKLLQQPAEFAHSLWLKQQGLLRLCVSVCYCSAGSRLCVAVCYCSAGQHAQHTPGVHQRSWRHLKGLQDSRTAGVHVPGCSWGTQRQAFWQAQAVVLAHSAMTNGLLNLHVCQTNAHICLARCIN